MNLSLSDIALVIHHLTPPALFWALVAITLLTLLGRRHTRAAATYALAVILTTGTVGLLKLAVDAPRPVEALVVLSSSAFPSGHAASAMFLAVTYSWLLNIRTQAQRWQTAFRISFYTLALIIGFSRIAIDVHTLPQVLAGFLIGLCIPWMLIRVRA